MLLLTNKKSFQILALGAFFLPTFGWAQLSTDQQKASYAIGVDIGQSISSQEVKLDIDSLILGIQDAMSGSKLKLSDQQMAAAIETLKAEVEQQQQEKMQAIAAENAKIAADFFAQNAKKSGVTTLDSGIQYKVETAGSGKSLSEQGLSDEQIANAQVTAHYRGSLLNGEEFDSSYQRKEPAEFALQGVIQGWQQAVPLMKPGAKWTVYIPAELGYGKAGVPNVIAPNSALIFEIELLEVKI